MQKPNPKSRSHQQHDLPISPLVPLAERGEELLDRCRKLSERLIEQTRRLGVRDGPAKSALSKVMK